MDILFETIGAIMLGVILFIILRKRKQYDISKMDGWIFIIIGFACLFFGMLIDISDNFPSLNKFIILGETPYQSFLEKIVGDLLGYVFLALGVMKWVPKVADFTQKTSNKLKTTESELKTLTGLLPICANCKKIRDSEGYWNKIESYISQRSEAQFSHGLCEDCMEELYGDKKWYKEAKEKKDKP